MISLNLKSNCCFFGLWGGWSLLMYILLIRWCADGNKLLVHKTDSQAACHFILQKTNCDIMRESETDRQRETETGCSRFVWGYKRHILMCSNCTYVTLNGFDQMLFPVLPMTCIDVSGLEPRLSSSESVIYSTQLWLLVALSVPLAYWFGCLTCDQHFTDWTPGHHIAG